jgi:hypothetical protein
VADQGLVEPELPSSREHPKSVEIGQLHSLGRDPVEPINEVADDGAE